MPAFVRRLRRSFQRNYSRASTAAYASPTNKSPDLENEGGLADERYYYQDEPTKRGGGRSSPYPLPVIKDAGPPTANRYANDDIFWNSTMVESDYSDIERGQRKVWRTPFKARGVGTDSSADTKQAKATPSDSSREKESDESATKPKAPKLRRSGRRGLERLDSRISYGKERADNDLIVMIFREPDYNPPPRSHRRRRSSSISPYTRVSNEFKEFGFGYDDNDSVRMYQAGVDSPHTMPEQSALDQEPHAISNFSDQSSSESPEGALTWNVCLKRILTNAHVDPEVKEAVRERLEHSTTTNGVGVGDEDFVFITAAEAGLVPNFSYPIAGSSFYDRLHAEKMRSKALKSQVIDTQTDATAREEVDEADDRPTPNHHQPKDTIRKRQLPPRYSSSSSTTSGSLYSDPTPGDRPKTPEHYPRIPGRIRNLLRTHLTPSELHLCRQVLSFVPSDIPPTFPPHKPANEHSSAKPSSPVDPVKPTKPIYNPTNPPVRLIAKLHTIIHGLQDRIMYSEDTLVPQLGAALEKKTYTVDVLSVEVQNLGDQIKELKTTVDFSNKILAGCWLREYEVWRTLAGMRQKRSARSPLRVLKRWTKRGRAVRRVEEGVLSPMLGSEGMEGSSGSKGSKDSKGSGRLTDRELDAMVLMAEQNVKILREDVEDMVERVEKCKRGFVAFPAAEVEEGSWRDV